MTGLVIIGLVSLTTFALRLLILPAAIIFMLLGLWLFDLVFDRPRSRFSSELGRIERGVRHATREVARLEREAMRTINDEAIRHRLGR